MAIQMARCGKMARSGGTGAVYHCQKGEGHEGDHYAKSNFKLRDGTREWMAWTDAQCIPPFCYDVFIADTGRHVGGGEIPMPEDDEQAFVLAHKTWEKHYPGVELHVEQISAADYNKALGR